MLILILTASAAINLKYSKIKFSYVAELNILIENNISFDKKIEELIDKIQTNRTDLTPIEKKKQDILIDLNKLKSKIG
jgi:hypothetical protein